MPKPVRDIGASVRARLLALSRKQGQAFDLLLTRYALERLLYRLSISRYRARFVLKGAMLITTWFEDPHRATRDVDLLGYGDPSPAPMLATFREIVSIAADDGLTFDIDALHVDLIREELAYGGLRLRTTAALAGARISIVIDIGFGDAVEPGIEEIDLPVLLDLPAPHLCAYSRETVIAEKFHAMVVLGRANSRMKDFYDVWVLGKSYDFSDDRLAQAISATFRRRGTPLPTVHSRRTDSGVRKRRCKTSSVECVKRRFCSHNGVVRERDQRIRGLSHAKGRPCSTCRQDRPMKQ